MKNDTERRRKAERLGRKAEWLVAFAYLLRGYQVLQRRYKVKSGEVDLIFRKKQVVVLCEVKARSDLETAIEAVTAKSRRRIERAGQYYLTKNAHLAEQGVRYDIAHVKGWWPNSIKDAWREGD